MSLETLTTLLKSGKLRLSNPANTFFYNWTGAAIAADRTINMPLLTAADEPLFKDFAATVTNKSISGSTNTFTNIGDSAISSHTSTKITITAKGQLNSAIVYNDQANVFGANNQTIPIANLLLSNNANTGAFGVQASLTGTRVWSMPNSSTNILGHNTTDTLTNKTYDAAGTGNVLSNVADANISSHTSTKITITAKGQLNSQIGYKDDTVWLTNAMIANTTIDLQAKGVKGSGTALQALRVNSGATALEWASLDSERTGKALANGDGSTTVFNIAHGLGSTPSYAFVDCSSHAIARTWTVTSTNIVVTFATAPGSGTNNVIIYWRVIA